MDNISLINYSGLTTYENVSEVRVKNGNGIWESWIHPTGTKYVVQNGAYDVSQFSSLNVAVPSTIGETPQLYAPTVTLTDEGFRTSIQPYNPISNGVYAQTLNCYCNGQLISTKTAYTHGHTNYGKDPFTDVSLFSGDEGLQSISLTYTGATLYESEPVTYDINMYSFNYTKDPNIESVAKLDPSTRAVHAGSTYTTYIYNASGNIPTIPLYLPNDIFVTMNGEECDYSWDNDTSSGDSTIQGMCRRRGLLTIPNITGPVSVALTTTSKFELDAPTLTAYSYNNKNYLFIGSAPYATGLSIAIDGTAYTSVLGITYSWTNVTTDYSAKGKFSDNSYATYANLPTGGPVAASQYNCNDNSFCTCTLNLYANTAQSLVLAYTMMSANTNQVYGIFSKLDKTLSNTMTDSTTNIFATVKENSPDRKLLTPYTVSAGTHTIMAKYRCGTTSTYQGYFGLMPYYMCSTTLPLLDYDEHEYQIIATADGCVDNVSTFTYAAPSLRMSYLNFGRTYSNIAGVTNVISGATYGNLYIDDNLVAREYVANNVQICFDDFIDDPVPTTHAVHLELECGNTPVSSNSLDYYSDELTSLFGTEGYIYNVSDTIRLYQTGSLRILWGDGTSSTTQSSAGTITISHTYTTSNSYRVISITPVSSTTTWYPQQNFYTGGGGSSVSSYKRRITWARFGKCVTNVYRAFYSANADSYGLDYVRLNYVSSISGAFYAQKYLFNYGCIIFDAKTPPAADSSTFSGATIYWPSSTSWPNSSGIFVPDDCVDIYKAASGFSSVRDYINPKSHYGGDLFIHA